MKTNEKEDSNMSPLLSQKYSLQITIKLGKDVMTINMEKHDILREEMGPAFQHRVTHKWAVSRRNQII